MNTKSFFLALISVFFVLSAAFPQSKSVASFKGQQVTGVTVAKNGRIFANFPCWRQTVDYSVVEIKADGSSLPYPNAYWNSWKTTEAPRDSAFAAIQSVVAKDDKLYVLDTRNPLWKGVMGAPRIFIFDLKTNRLIDILVLSEGSFKANSYSNDLRIDTQNKAIYITDSNEAGLIVYDLKKRKSRRVLDAHFSTIAEANHLMIDGKQWGGKPVHSDGIALNEKNGRLYYHALTGHTLYSVSTILLRTGSEAEIEKDVRKEAITPAPDGMIFDGSGKLYMADLENQKIVYLTPDKRLMTLTDNRNEVKWADTFSIYNGYLYYTNSRIHEARGDVSEMIFDIRKIKLP